MFRNKEIRQFNFCFLMIGMIGISIGFKMAIPTGILMIVFTAAFGAVFFCFTRVRYQRIARLAEQIDLVLHKEEPVYLDALEEGELAILQSEITKMTRRIHEQNEALKKEKAYLAQSLADIAHQLRTPLTSANLILSLLKKNPSERERRTLLRENQELFVQMDWLVNALLKLSRLDAGMVVFEREKVKVETLINNATSTLMIPMELHDIQLKVDVDQEARLLCDSKWTIEVMVNLLKNCMESTGDHGQIEVSGEDNPLFTEITVHDYGKGFTNEELAHLFDRFYRGKNANATGYGIGLALCKSIITSQGGRIVAKNHPQGGALFIIHFSKECQ